MVPLGINSIQQQKRKSNKIRINLSKKGKEINISTRATAFGFQPKEISHPNSGGIGKGKKA